MLGFMGLRENSEFKEKRFERLQRLIPYMLSHAQSDIEETPCNLTNIDLNSHQFDLH